MLNWILLVVVGVCFLGIVFIVVRKLPFLKVLNVKTVKQAQADLVKDRLLYDRFIRQTKKSSAFFKKATVPMTHSLSSGVRSMFHKLYSLEKKYQREARGVAHNLTKEEINAKLAEVLAEAGRAIKDGQWAEAEKKYIEAVSFDPKAQSAYEGLAEVYLELKQYGHALQTYLYILKLETKNSVIVEKKDESGVVTKTLNNAVALAALHSDIGKVCKFLGKQREALRHYTEAAILEQNNPKYLDQLIELAVAEKNKSVAFDAMKKLEAVNPENQKLKEYSEIIASL